MVNIQDSLISFLSHVTNLGSDKYVKEFVRAPLLITEGRKTLQTSEEKEAFSQLENIGKLIEAMMDKYPVLKKLDERIYISIIDLNDLHFTAIIKNEQVNISLGWDINTRPTLQVPLYRINLQHLFQAVSDKELTEEEMYRIARVLFVPFTRALYHVDYFYTKGDKRYLKLYNLYHVELVGMEHINVDGFPGNAKATVANVNGQWLIFEGFQGIPKMKVNCTLKQSLDYYQILMIEMKKVSSIDELKKIFDKYMKLREETVVDLTEGD